MKNNKGFVETCILLFCIASIITIVLFSEHMLELAEHKNDDKLYEEVLKCNKIKNYTYDIYLVDGHYILYDENNDLVVYTEKDNKLNKINVGKANIQYTENNEHPYVEVIEHSNDSKELSDSNWYTVYTSNGNIDLKYDNFNYKEYTVYIPKEEIN